jgi:hypothetical protein
VPPVRERLVEHLPQDLRVFGREHRFHPLDAGAAGQGADHGEQVVQGAKDERAPRLGVEAGQTSIERLRGIKEERKQLLSIGLRTFGEDPIDERTQGARGVVDDVAQLHVLTVNIAEHVDRALRQRQLRGQPRDLRGGGGRVAEPARQHAQHGKLGFGERSGCDPHDPRDLNTHSSRGPVVKGPRRE